MKDNGYYEYELLDDATGELLTELSEEGWELQYCTPVGLGIPAGLHVQKVIFGALFRRWVAGETPVVTEEAKDATQELPVVAEEVEVVETSTPLERLAEAGAALDADESPALVPDETPIRTVTGTVIGAGETPYTMTKEERLEQIRADGRKKWQAAWVATFERYQATRDNHDVPLYALVEKASA